MRGENRKNSEPNEYLVLADDHNQGESEIQTQDNPL